MSDVSLLFNIFARDAASPTFRKVGVEAEAASKGVSKMGKALGAFALIDIGAHAAKMAGDFQQETSILVTAAGESQGALGAVRKGIQDISIHTGTGLKQLSDGMYQVEKAGYRGADGLAVLKAASQASAEEGADLATVTSSITSVMRSYNIPVKDVVSVTNQLKTAAGESKTTMESFAGSLATVLPVASKAGIGLDDVLGALSGLTQHGTSADEATQELAFTIRNLQAPSNVAVKAMAQLGINSQDVSKMLGKAGLTGTLNYLSESVLKQMGPAGTVLLKTFYQSQTAAADLRAELKNLGPATQGLAKDFLAGKMTAGQWRTALKDLPVDQANLARQFATTANKAHGFNDAIKGGGASAVTYTKLIKDMTGGANGLNTTLQLTGDSAPAVAEAVAKIAEAGKNSGKDVAGWAIQQKNFNQRMKEFKQTLDVLMVKIGNALIPVLGNMATALTAIFGWIGKNKAVVVPFVAVLTTFATTIWAINKATAVWASVTKAAAVVTKIFTGEERALNLTFLASPIGLTVLAIVGLVAAFILAYKHCARFRAIVNSAFSTAKHIIVAVFDWVKGNWPLLLGILTGPIGLAVVEIVKHFHAIVAAAKALPGKAASAIGDLASTLYNKGLDFIQGFINGIISKAKDIPGVIKDKVVGAAQSALHGFGLFGSPSRLTIKYGKWWTDGFVIGMKAKKADVLQAAQDMIDKLKEKIQTVKDFAKSIKDAFVTGGDLSNIDSQYGLNYQIGQLRDQASTDKAYADGITQLRKMGLNDTTLGQLRDAGPSANGSVQNLLGGGAGGIATVNGLMKQITRTGKNFGNSEAFAQYGLDLTKKQKITVKSGKQEIHLTVDSKGDAGDALLTILRKSIRAKGGNVQLVLGKG